MHKQNLDLYQNNPLVANISYYTYSPPPPLLLFPPIVTNQVRASFLQQNMFLYTSAVGKLLPPPAASDNKIKKWFDPNARERTAQRNTQYVLNGRLLCPKKKPICTKPNEKCAENPLLGRHILEVFPVPSTPSPLGGGGGWVWVWYNLQLWERRGGLGAEREVVWSSPPP